MSIANDRITVLYKDGAWYGISLGDLATAFHSSYHDLVALICADGGVDNDVPESLSDPYDSFTYNGTEFRSAFALSDIGTDGARSDAMPIPAGASFKTWTTPPKRAYVRGDLIIGRKPKWNLWADGINVGKSVVPDGGGYVFRYNIFENPWRLKHGTSSKTFSFINDIPGFWPADYPAPSDDEPMAEDGFPDLLSWQNYHILPADVHKPFFRLELIGDGAIEWHNGVPVECSTSTKLNCIRRSGYIITDDASELFIEEDGAGQRIGRATMALGNLVDWWMPSEVSKRYYPLYGMSAVLKIQNGDDDADIITIAQAVSAASSEEVGGDGNALGADTSQNLVMLYRDGKEAKEHNSLRLVSSSSMRLLGSGGMRLMRGESTDGGYRYYDMSPTGEHRVIVWNKIVDGVTYPQGTADMKFVAEDLKATGALEAIHAPRDEWGGQIPPVSERVDLRQIVGETEINMASVCDTYTQTQGTTTRTPYRSRFILDGVKVNVGSGYAYRTVGFGEGGDQTFVWPATPFFYADDDKQAPIKQDNAGEHTRIFFQFYFFKQDNATPLALFDEYGNPVLFACWDITFCNPSNGKVSGHYRINKPVTDITNTGLYGDDYGIDSDMYNPWGTLVRNTSYTKEDNAIAEIGLGDVNLPSGEKFPAGTTAKLRIKPLAELIGWGLGYLTGDDGYDTVSDMMRYSISDSDDNVYEFFFADREISDTYLHFLIYTEDEYGHHPVDWGTSLQVEFEVVHNGDNNDYAVISGVSTGRQSDSATIDGQTVGIYVDTAMRGAMIPYADGSQYPAGNFKYMQMYRMQLNTAGTTGFWAIRPTGITHID